jgi:hypothetical protein
MRVPFSGQASFACAGEDLSWVARVAAVAAWRKLRRLSDLLGTDFSYERVEIGWTTE